MKSRLRCAFTPVEIVVVLAILGVLAALLLPVFGRVRQNGYKTTCASNLRGLASAMQIYLQDSGGVFPIARERVVVKGVSDSLLWSDRVKTSAPIQSILQCPAVPEEAFWDATDTRYNLGREVSTDAQHKGAPFRAPFQLRHLSQLPATATTELFTEGGASSGGVSLTGRPIPTKNCGPQDMFNLHLDGANIAYLDGHVKWMSAEQQAQSDEVCGW